jgi:hypothetical protein
LEQTAEPPDARLRFGGRPGSATSYAAATYPVQVVPGQFNNHFGIRLENFGGDRFHGGLLRNPVTATRRLEEAIKAGTNREAAGQLP